MGETGCKKCEAGKYQNKNGQDGCLTCPLSGIAPNTSSTSCVECPQAMMANAERTACVPCAFDTVRAMVDQEDVNHVRVTRCLMLHKQNVSCHDYHFSIPEKFYELVYISPSKSGRI